VEEIKLCERVGGCEGCELNGLDAECESLLVAACGKQVLEATGGAAHTITITTHPPPPTP
jgi:hypothetical protein